jgi:protein phosphatase
MDPAIGPEEIIAHFEKQFSPILGLTPEEISKVGTRIPIPSFDADQIKGLLVAARPYFNADADPVLDLSLPAWVIGDLHGNFHDLLRILTTIGPESSDLIVFLGDFVDRGTYSIEVVLVLVILKCVHPRQVYCIRGNHEFSNVNSEYGFKEEVESRYPDSSLWGDFNDLFSIFPLAILLDRRYVCLHGGIGPNVPSIQSIRKVPMPLASYENYPAVCQIVWSDPSDTTTDFLISPRGSGYIFGSVALLQFLQKSKCQTLVRAHETVQYGAKRFCSDLGVTVFSSSNYMGRGNSGAFIRLAAGADIDAHQLDPLSDAVERSQAVYNPVVPFVSGKHHPLQQIARLGSLRTTSLTCFRPQSKPGVLTARTSEVKGLRKTAVKGLSIGLGAPLRSLSGSGEEGSNHAATGREKGKIAAAKGTFDANLIFHKEEETS